MKMRIFVSYKKNQICTSQAAKLLRNYTFVGILLKIQLKAILFFSRNLVYKHKSLQETPFFLDCWWRWLSWWFIM